MSESQGNKLISFRVETPHIMPMPGSTKQLCARCRHSVWISPVSQDMIYQQKLTIWCMTCIIETKATGDVAAITEEQIAEMPAKVRAAAAKIAGAKITTNELLQRYKDDPRFK